MKVVKWVAVGFVGLVVLGALVGSSDEDSDEPNAARIAEGPDSIAEPTPEPEATPTPKPELDVEITSPNRTTSDEVTLRGTVSMPGAKVRVKGQRGRAVTARVKGRRWAADVRILGLGNNIYRVSATRKGAVKGTAEHRVVRKQSAAERAAARAEERAEFIAAAETLDYDQLAKNPERHRGTKVAYRGQIFQIGEDFGQTWMLLAVTDEGYGFWDDNVWVTYHGTIEGAEDDIITVYGTVKGEFSYETQIGGETYVPEIKARYIVE